MKQQIEDQRIIKQYLLGELDQDKQRHFEERLLTEDECLEELSAAEDELTDEYVAGALSAHERERFERHFLSTPERHRQLKFARSLKRYIATTGAAESAKTSSVFQPSLSKRWFPSFLHINNPARAFSLTAALLLFFSIALILETQRRQHQAGTEQRASTALEKDPGAPKQPAAPYFAVTLTPGLTRDAGEIKKVLVPAGVNAVQLRLELAADDYPSYRAVIRTDDGREVYASKPLPAEMAGSVRIVTVSVPAKLLIHGDYQLKLSGLNANNEFEDVCSYSLRVLKS